MFHPHIIIWLAACCSILLGLFTGVVITVSVARILIPKCKCEEHDDD